jgi:hypothetical protein
VASCIPEDGRIALKAFLLALPAIFLAIPIALAEPFGRPPNVVIIYVDDMGYADLGCFGAQNIRTPHIDRMAREGVRFTDFYVAQAVSADKARVDLGDSATKQLAQACVRRERSLNLSSGRSPI